MPCNKGSKKWKNIMAKVRRMHPNWGLSRRKNLAYGMYNYKKKKRRY